MGIYPVSKSYSLPQSWSPQSPMKYFTESTSPFPVTRTKYSKQFFLRADDVFLLLPICALSRPCEDVTSVCISFIGKAAGESAFGFVLADLAVCFKHVDRGARAKKRHTFACEENGDILRRDLERIGSGFYPDLFVGFL